MATLIPAISTCVARMTGGRYQSGADAIQVMTMKVSKGLEFPVVALPGVGQLPSIGRRDRPGF